MTRIVRIDKRTQKRPFPREIIIVEFDSSKIEKTAKIPEKIQNDYDTKFLKLPNKAKIFGFVDFEGLNKKDIINIYRLSGSGKVRFGVTRMGHIQTYKLVK